MRQFSSVLPACVLALLLNTVCVAATSAQIPPGIPVISPQSAGFDETRLKVIEEVVQEGLSQSKMPGCVVVVGCRAGVVYQGAWGHRQTVPQQQPMELTTVFDLASLTKPIATATSIMLLIQQEKIRVDAPAATYWPEFAQQGKDGILIRHLLTHTAGLIADNSINDYTGTPDESMAKIAALKPVAAPGEQFIYSDVGFLVLGRIVQLVSGKNVHEFSRESVFQPLGMTETGYLPGPELRARAVVTEQREDRWMQGEVHDPRAYALQGIAGHAGLFSTASDLARYAVMMLNHGSLGSVQILQPDTWKLMTTAVDVPRGRRTPGWDSRTGYSSNRGDLMTAAAFGHGGFTGTGIWIDPLADLFVIFLSNRVHPDGKGLVNPLIGRIGTIAAGARRTPPKTPTAQVLNGIDVLQRDGFAALQGRKVGLITNQTGLSREGVSTVRLLHSAKGVRLNALFSPEHGLEGRLDIPKIGDQQDTTTGLKVFSLYGETRTPTRESLQDLDTLVFDIQDIGCRFYTYLSTMGNAMQAAADHNLQFVVLDRVNPVGGTAVDGPVLEDGEQSFVGYHTIPVRHGMTAGELARMFSSEKNIKVDLQIIPVAGWQRSQWFDETGLTWTNPSPNMRNLNQALLYPGVGLLEMTNLSVGRGTDTPFEIIGAPWLKEQRFAEHLNAAGLPGIRFIPVRFTPLSAKFPNEVCGGVQLMITDRLIVDPLATGIQLMCSLQALHPTDWQTKNLNRLLSSVPVRDAVLAGRDRHEIQRLWQTELAKFMERRQQFLLYE
jgi:uncharacterized protein YbbC (DUF1343 family)